MADEAPNEDPTSNAHRQTGGWQNIKGEKSERVGPEDVEVVMGDDGRPKKVVEGEVDVKKKPFFRRAKESLFGDDTRGAADYVLRDVLIPAARNLIVDMVTQGVQRAVWGDKASPFMGGGYRPSKTSGYVSYNNMSSASPFDRSGRGGMTDRGGGQELDFVIHSRQDAEIVLERMYDMLERTNAVSVADVRDLCGLPTNHTHYRWGWVSLRGSRVVQTKDGYLLDVPRPEPILP